MEPKRVLSQAVEDYLKTIYKLQSPSFVSTTEIARALSVSPASATNMAKRLDSMGLADYRSYQGVQLTDAGTKIALEVLRHHRLLETYLREVMGYSWEQMHTEAEHLEHHISEEFEDRIEELLGFPTHDPHGHPIPTRDGNIIQEPDEPLSSSIRGKPVVICRVADSDSALLEQLEQLGLMPGAKITVINFADDQVIIGVDSKEVAIDHELAACVFVSL